jgi:hypothetical protein
MSRVRSIFSQLRPDSAVFGDGPSPVMEVYDQFVNTVRCQQPNAVLQDRGPCTRNMGFGTFAVKGRKRVPSPAARIVARTYDVLLPTPP